MAKRLSMFFSSKDTSLPRSSSGTHLDVEVTPPPTPSRGKLTKPMTKSPSDLHLNTHLAMDLEAPPVFTDTGMYSRPSSRDGRTPTRTDTNESRPNSGSRPQTPMLEIPGSNSPVRYQSPGVGKTNKRKSWIPGRSDKQSSEIETNQPASQAWIAGLNEHIAYDLTALMRGEPVKDLWDDDGDVLVHLFPQTTNRGPSFRVKSQLFADSSTMSYLVETSDTNGRHQNSSINADPSELMGALFIQDQTQPYQQFQYSRPTYRDGNQVKSVYLPAAFDGDYSHPEKMPSGDDFELLVVYRNFFSFLCGGALVSTHRQNSVYALFMSISSILKRLGYGNEKGSSWGTIPWNSFVRYTDELGLADVRSSREKNIEAILIGHAMKSWPLYAEGFIHAVGRLEDIKSINSPKFSKIHPTIVRKLERASHDLQRDRLGVLHAKLDSFDFPYMFSGIANSQTATEAKLVRFKAWKAYFLDFRQYVLGQYKKRYGSWPPKASSKKNNFEESGLNRLLIREVYQDFIDLYELLVDRTSLTPRTAQMSTLADDAESGSNETIQHALRSVESEYDRATPPVIPAIPFDVPIIPAFGRQMLAKDAQNAKKLRDNELHELLLSSYNRDGATQKLWVRNFLDYERKLCNGKNINDIADIRCGQWLLIYAVLQALPMTVVDARDVKYTEGVEYFLCEAPTGGRPWLQHDESSSRSWYNVANGGGLISLPADYIDHSVEGTYRRSYCWTIANKWAAAIGPMSPIQAMPTTNLFPPLDPSIPASLAPAGRSPAASPYVSPYVSPLLKPAVTADNDVPSGLPRVSSRTMLLGLQEVAAPVQTTRPVSQYNPNVTFDDIFKTKQIDQAKGRRSKK